MQSRCFQKVSDQDHIQHILQCVDTGIDGTEVCQSASDPFGLSSDEPSRHLQCYPNNKNSLGFWMPLLLYFVMEAIG